MCVYTPLAWPAAAVIGILFLALPAPAEESDPAALAVAMEKVPTTLEQGLQASESKGKPISAKFEVEDGKLQLSIYTMTTDGFNEVIVAPETGEVMKSEKITDDEDLDIAAGQKAAMEKASTSLLTATRQALRQSAGSRAVSVYPELQSGHAVASVTLLRDGRLSRVTENLD